MTIKLPAVTRVRHYRCIYVYPSRCRIQTYTRLYIQPDSILSEDYMGSITKLEEVCVPYIIVKLLLGIDIAQ